MKITCGCFVYNEEKYLKYALGSIKDWVDELIVIDGSPDGPSTDKTGEILQSFKDELGDRMVIESGAYANKEVQQNEYIKHVQDDTHWLFIIPGDEVYKPGDLEKLSIMMEHCPRQATAVHYKHMHFWVDFNHYVTGGIWENTLYRINRWSKGNRYRVHNGLGDRNGRSLDRYAAVTKEKLVYHYGHAKGEKAEFEKMYYYGKRGDFKNVRDDEHAKRHAEAFVRNWKNMVDKGIREFTGDHPPMIAGDIKNGVVQATIDI